MSIFSACFGHHYAHLQENKTCVTARGVLRWFCWMWLVAVVGRCVVGCEHCVFRPPLYHTQTHKHPEGILWTSDQPVEKSAPNITLNEHKTQKNPWSRRNSNPQSQQWVDINPTSYSAWTLESHLQILAFENILSFEFTFMNVRVSQTRNSCGPPATRRSQVASYSLKAPPFEDINLLKQ